MDDSDADVLTVPKKAFTWIVANVKTFVIVSLILVVLLFVLFGTTKRSSQSDADAQMMYYENGNSSVKVLLKSDDKLVTRKELDKTWSALDEANKKIDDLESNLEEANKKASDLERGLEETNTRINKKVKELEQNLGEANTRNNKKASDLERSLGEANTRKSKKASDLERSLEAESTRINNKLQDLERNIGKANSGNNNNNNNHGSTVPIGFIYTQLPKQAEPTTLWPFTLWLDVSSEYAGLFFRVTGAGAETFGFIQNENCPKVTHFTTFQDGPAMTMARPGAIPKKITEIERSRNCYLNGIAFNVTTGEVRPRNTAIRIWKRLA